jgi:hypothetical protein
MNSPLVEHIIQYPGETIRDYGPWQLTADCPNIEQMGEFGDQSRYAQMM